MTALIIVVIIVIFVFFGKHDLKFGVEIERSSVRSRYSYTDGISYYDYTAYYPAGQYLAYEYSYDLEGRNQRESFYAQDSWKPTERLTINAGVRVDFVRGRSPVLDETVYDNTNWAPRLGFAFDLTGDGKTALKGSYGQYFDGIYYANYRNALPGIEDYITYLFDPAGDKCGPRGNCFSEDDRSPGVPYGIDPEMTHPRVDEWTLGLDRDLGRDLRLSVTGIYREDKNVEGTVYPDARWTPRSVTNNLTGQPLLVYNCTPSSPRHSRRHDLRGFDQGGSHPLPQFRLHYSHLHPAIYLRCAGGDQDCGTHS